MVFQSSHVRQKCEDLTVPPSSMRNDLLFGFPSIALLVFMIPSVRYAAV